jgi:type VI secretion system secreted protein Hcp
MAFDAFIKIDGIESESTDDQHPGWIEIIAYRSGHSMPISKRTSSTQGATLGRVNFDTFTFSKLIDKSSPLLLSACAAGTHIDEITVELCRAGTDKVKFMAYKFKNGLISSVLTSSGDPNNGFPVELVKIAFGKIEWCYHQQNRSGGWASGHIAAAWDLQRNCKA